MTRIGATDKSLIVVQLSGGNDALNTIVPYTDGLYYDYRPNINISQDEVLPIDKEIGFNPNIKPIKALYDEGKVAIINGIGYPNPDRSHFRSMDIWHTAESEGIGSDGWLGRAIRDLDPHGENVVTGVNFGRGLPRALAAKGVPVASVGNLATYGFLPDIKENTARGLAMEAFSQIYGGAGKDTIAKFFSQTGAAALRGADALRTAPLTYKSNVEYANTPISQNMKSIAQVLFADLGTRVFYTQHSSFDTHASEITSHAKLWQEVSAAIADFMDDVKEHDRESDTILLLFSEFGRRIKDNGAGTDHGSGGMAFVIGGEINGGIYGQFPSLRPQDQLEGDMHFNNDFRGTYSTIAEQWLNLDATTITNGTFEQLGFINGE